MDWKNDRIGSALKGDNPTVLLRMRSGFAVIGDPQFLPGYCVLLAYPKVNSINDLDVIKRKEFLLDMTLIGDAITEVCHPIRINYDILGNLDTFLHAHIFPRYQWEEEELRKNPVWKYPKENWMKEEHQFTEKKHGKMKKAIAKKLEELMSTIY
ncbi:hypothetical protein IAI10_00945 [Clostridium sp. 19966]|uniref:HIT family protein n=1 Tax=Clostridium sp. 19966 TaxID=2768166 RepID=UPI0028DF5453|nr:hypothetical protein [Clostridium sp. 19966]MDT8715245.1 hypothetical protein [Clostridium sp. 19966]